MLVIFFFFLVPFNFLMKTFLMFTLHKFMPCSYLIYCIKL